MPMDETLHLWAMALVVLERGIGDGVPIVVLLIHHGGGPHLSYTKDL